MVLIDFAEAREILDSRGYPTIEVKVVLNNGVSAISSVPSGVTKSPYEAIELRDADASRYSGQGVTHAIKNINEIISPRLKKMNPLEQANIDKVLLELDQTPNKAHLGTNATLAVSQAVARIGAMVNDKPLWLHLNEIFLKTRAKSAIGEEAELINEQRTPMLPIPIFSVINGGKHTRSPFPLQEVSIIPAKSLKPPEQLRFGTEIRHNLERVFLDTTIFFGDGLEGGLVVNVDDLDVILKSTVEAIKRTSLKPRQDVALAIDFAADYWENFNMGEQVKLYERLLQEYPIVLMEDPLPSRDMVPWVHLRAMLHKQQTLLVGDDVIATNADRLREAIKQKAIDISIIKPNQVGTISETLETAKIAKHHGVGTMVAGRSGETEDSFVTDLAVAIGADYFKAGAPVHSERTAKYNRLIKIFEENNWS